MSILYGTLFSDKTVIMSDSGRSEAQIRLKVLSSLLLSNLFAFQEYLIEQIKFLRSFDYSKTNIKEHLYKKACQFFGFEIIELKNGRKKVVKAFKRKRRKKKLRLLKLMFVKNVKEKSKTKRSVNTYKPPS